MTLLPSRVFHPRLLSSSDSLSRSFGHRKRNHYALSWTLKSGVFKSSTRPDYFRYGPLHEKSSTRWQVLLRVCLCCELEFYSTSMYLPHIIPKVSSLPPCNSSNSISGEQHILVPLDSLGFRIFRQSERESCIQTMRFMLHVFSPPHCDITLMDRSLC